MLYKCYNGSYLTIILYSEEKKIVIIITSFNVNFTIKIFTFIRIAWTIEILYNLNRNKQKLNYF